MRQVRIGPLRFRALGGANSRQGSRLNLPRGWLGASRPRVVPKFWGRWHTQFRSSAARRAAVLLAEMAVHFMPCQPYCTSPQSREQCARSCPPGFRACSEHAAAKLLRPAVRPRTHRGLTASSSVALLGALPPRPSILSDAVLRARSTPTVCAKSRYPMTHLHRVNWRFLDATRCPTDWASRGSSFC